MRKIILLGGLCLSLCCHAQYNYKNLDVKFENPAPPAAGQPAPPPSAQAQKAYYTYQSLRLYPIKAKEEFRREFTDIGRYTPLKEAIEKKMVLITENGSGGTVSQLLIENVSKDTIIILSGEVIKGGKQDRVIRQDLVLAPNSGKIDLFVFCVEASRWSQKSSGNNFDGYYNVSSMSLRKVVDKENNQSQVWKKVDEFNAKNKTTTGTKTYTALTNSPEFAGKLLAYTTYFKDQLYNEENVIGVVVVSGDKVLGCDMFATSDLFKKNFENLISSYATEAIINGADVTITPAVVKTYMDKLLTDDAQQEATIEEKGKAFKNGNGKKIRVSSYD